MRTTILTWLALAPLAVAQEPPMEAPQPAPELAKLDRLLGSWEGSGTVYTGPDDREGTPWTSRSHAQRVMGGHFVRTDTQIEIAGRMAGTLAFVTWYGFDPEKGKLVAYEISNMGTLQGGEIHWTGESEMTTVSSSTWQGEPKVERWVTKLDGDTHEFVGEEVLGTGPWFVHVEGTSKKLAEDQPVSLEGISSFMAPSGPEMERAAAIAGRYELEGWFKMTPEMPKMEFSGIETIRPIFGGAILEFTSSDHAGHYEGWHALAYDAEAGHYRSVGLNNMGHVGPADAWIEGDEWIFTHAGTMQGTPAVSRSVLTTDTAGKVAGFSTHTLFGTAAPVHGFEASYALLGDAAARPASAPADEGAEH